MGLAALTCALVFATLSAPAGAAAVSVGDGLLYGDLGAAAGSGRIAADAALRDAAGRLGVDADDFRFESVHRSLVGYHVRGREFRGGVPVAGSSAGVTVVEGRVVWVEARQVRLPGSATANPIPRAIAHEAARRAVGAGSAADVLSERLLVPFRGRLMDAYRVSVFSLQPAIAAVVEVGAANAGILDIRSEAQRVDGTATVFDPNPVVTAKNSALRQPLEMGLPADVDVDSAELTAQLKTLPALGLDLASLPAGRLLGPWADVQGPAPHLPTGQLNYTRGDPRFESAMAYVHIDRIQRYFQSLGFVGETAVNAEPQTVIALPVLGFDNSFYQPANDLLLFGAGGVDDGEDAEVIIHEYGHAVQDAQVPGWGTTNEGGAMGEGFGDFLGATYYAPQSGGFGDLCVMDWDATSYSSDNPPCLRRLDSGKRYPEDVEGEVHADGEMWAEFMWNVRGRLGTTPREQTDNVLRLLLTSHELLSPNAGFGDAVAALLVTATAMEQPKWNEAIAEEATQMGFLTLETA